MTAATPFRGVLLDIEGTTSSIEFVFKVMFPFVRDHLSEYLAKQSLSDTCTSAANQIAIDAGFTDLQSAFGGSLVEPTVQVKLCRHVLGLMDADVKATGLKSLQGLIWEDAFRSGQMRAHVYVDVVPAMKRWLETGCKIWIYSSGSVHAQKLFFAHSIEGDLLPMISGHWDTTIGGKRDVSSYQKIASQIDAEAGIRASDLLFISDVVEELDAARHADLQTRLSIREGNKPVELPCGHVVIETFDSM